MQVEEDVLLGLTVGHPIGSLLPSMFTHQNASIFRLIVEYQEQAGENPCTALLMTLVETDNRISDLMRWPILELILELGNRLHDQPDCDRFDRGARALVNREACRTVLLHLHDLRNAVVTGMPLDVTMIEDCFETLRTIAVAEGN